MALDPLKITFFRVFPAGGRVLQYEVVVKSISIVTNDCKVPMVFSHKELRKLHGAVLSIKHHAAFSAGVSTGLLLKLAILLLSAS